MSGIRVDTQISSPQNFHGTAQQDACAVWNTFTDALPITPPPDRIEEAARDDVKASKPVTSSEKPLVAVIGVGYVGSNLVSEFAEHYDVVAFDVSKERLATVASQLSRHSFVTWTTEARQLAGATHFLVSVPTTLLPGKQIDTSHLRDAIATVAIYARPGATVVIESSVAVGMTRQLLSPLMRSRGLKAGMSPERVDPGRTNPPLTAIPKIISGLDDITPGSLASIQSLYSKVFTTLVPVSKPEAAEMAKLYENCQRMLCIAYANEMADACLPHNVDPFEVSRAAATKPFGYMPYSPGWGVGGHCIPVNPYYLLVNNEFPLLQAATEKMWQRPATIGDRAMEKLLRDGDKAAEFRTRKPRVLVVGAGFKRGQAALSFSPSVELMRGLLNNWDVHVSFADPLVEAAAIPYVPRLDERTEWNRTALEWFDLIVMGLRQEGLEYGVLEELGEGTTVEWWV